MAQAATKPELLEIISNAEKEHNIPKGLLLAVAKTESNLEAYALNISGRPHFFKDKNILSKYGNFIQSFFISKFLKNESLINLTFKTKNIKLLKSINKIMCNF
jgi:hypothetical protein